MFVSDEINLFLSPLGITAYLSIEMGAFLAGVSIAQLPYSKELQDRVNPLTDLFVMVFFVSVALSLEASQLLFYWERAVIAAVVLIIAKFIIFFVLLRWQRFDSETTFLGSIYMIQVSEFGVVVGVAALQGDFIGVEILGFLTLTALITMGVSVYLFAYGRQLYERLEPRLERLEAEETFTEEKREYRDHAIVVGYDGLTRNMLGLLDEHFEDVVVVDRDPEHIENLTEEGYTAVFGDLASSSIRKDVALKKAAFVLSSSTQTEISKTVLKETGEDATVILTAENNDDARALYERGADYVIQSVELSSDRLADYLAAELEDPDAFDRAVERDTAFLRDPKPFPDVHEETGGELDD